MEEESWLVLLRRCWVGRNGQPGNELHGSNDCLGKSATSTRIGVDERLGGRVDRKAFLLDKFNEVSCRLWEVVKRLEL